MIYETIGVDNEPFECEVEIYHNVVIVTETPKSRTGIILNAKTLANEICHQYSVPMQNLVWIEVIPPVEEGESTGYYLVMFTIENWVCTSQRSIPITAELVEAFRKYGKEWANNIKSAEIHNTLETINTKGV